MYEMDDRLEKIALTFFIGFLLGSVERDNAILKKILGNVCAERKKEGKSDNWVLCLGWITASLTGHSSRMADSVSLYKTVFGCDYHLLTSSTMNDAREAKPVKDILPLVMDDGHFACYIQTNMT